MPDLYRITACQASRARPTFRLSANRRLLHARVYLEAASRSGHRRGAKRTFIQQPEARLRRTLAHLARPDDRSRPPAPATCRRRYQAVARWSSGPTSNDVARLSSRKELRAVGAHVLPHVAVAHLGCGEGTRPRLLRWRSSPEVGHHASQRRPPHRQHDAVQSPAARRSAPSPGRRRIRRAAPTSARISTDRAVCPFSANPRWRDMRGPPPPVIAPVAVAPTVPC